MSISSNRHATSPTDMLYGPSVGDWQLLKPRVMSLVIFTGFAGMFVAPGGSIRFCSASRCWRLRPVPARRGDQPVV